MLPGQASKTALGAAKQRAAHQLLDGGRVFDDPLAVRILGLPDDVILREIEEGPKVFGRRLFLAARSRFAENRLAIAIAERAVGQMVILGAGLDTFAYRSTFGTALRIFEVDHPDTQAWKRHLLAEAKIETPSWLTFAPIDMEHEALPAGLAKAGFDPAQRTFFSWLGGVPYLSAEAVRGTLDAITGFHCRVEVVMDYGEPPESLPPAVRTAYDRRANEVAAQGEPWLSTFVPSALHDQLRARGLAYILDIGPRQIAERFFPRLAPNFTDHGLHFLHAVMP